MALELTINGVNNPPSSSRPEVTIEFFDQTYLVDEEMEDSRVYGTIQAISGENTIYAYPSRGQHYNLSEIYPSNTLLLIMTLPKDSGYPNETLTVDGTNSNMQLYLNGQPWSCADFMTIIGNSPSDENPIIGFILVLP